MLSAAGVVLVVEDNLETTDVLRRTLMLYGYRVVAAYNGLDAMQMLRDGLQPAAIGLDLAMPDMDGRAFRSALLADPELGRIPVVVYSAAGDTAALPGIVGYVRKGFDNPDLLLGFIEAACGRGRGLDRPLPQRSRPGS
jgi:CheY-like chemotaxis protein